LAWARSLQSQLGVFATRRRKAEFARPGAFML